jgi:hypothetical protein
LAFERLCHAGAPALGDGLGCGIGEDLLFTPFQSVEDAFRGSRGCGLWNVEAAVHVGVDGAEDDGVNRHAVAREARPKGLRHIQRRRLRHRIAGDDRQGRERGERQVVDDRPLGVLQHWQERARHLDDAEQIDGQLLFDGVEIARIVIDRDAGIVDEDVERADLFDCLPDLRGVRK